MPPSKTSTTAAHPAAKRHIDVTPARQNPNAEAMISIARGKEVITTRTHAKSFNPDVSVLFPELTIVYERAATVVTRSRKSAPSAALEAVAAAPQPSCPASARVVRIAAANHMRLRTARPKNTAEIKMRVRSPS